MSRRIERINELLKKLLGEILLREFDFGDVLVTITGVEATGNLQEAKVKITVMPENQEKKVLDILRRNIYEVQRILNKKLNMRPVPRIKFEIDKGAKKGYEMEKLLGEINTTKNSKSQIPNNK